jgi:hypothetical protein
MMAPLEVFLFEIYINGLPYWVGVRGLEIGVCVLRCCLPFGTFLFSFYLCWGPGNKQD